MATTTTREETHTIPNLSSRIDTTLPVTTEESVSRLMTATPCEYAANLPVAVYIHTRGLSEKSLGETFGCPQFWCIQRTRISETCAGATDLHRV